MTDHDILAAALASLQSADVEFVTHSLCNIRRGSGTWCAVGNELAEGDAVSFHILEDVVSGPRALTVQRQARAGKSA